MFEIPGWVEPVLLGGLDQAVDNGAGSCAFGSVREQPVLSTDDEWLDCSFGAVIVDFETAVQEERIELGPLIQAVAHRFSQGGLR